MKKHKSHVAEASLGQRAQERLGERIRLLGPRNLQFITLSCIAVLAILLTVIGVWLLPLPAYISGFVMISSLIWPLLLALAFFGSRDGAKPGKVRYRDITGSTWVSLPPLLGPMASLGFAFIGTALVGYGAVFVAFGVSQNSGDFWGTIPRAAWILGFASVVLSVYAWRMAFLSLRVTLGIRMFPNRVGINYQHRNITLYWGQIRNVTAEAVNRVSGGKGRVVSCVRIDTRDRDTFYVDIVQLGSDPNVVAAFMQYYLDRPQERDLLAHPEDAIRRFTDAQA